MILDDFSNGCRFTYCAEEYECIGISKNSIMAKKIRDEKIYVIEWEELHSCKLLK